MWVIGAALAGIYRATADRATTGGWRSRCGRSSRPASASWSRWATSTPSTTRPSRSCSGACSASGRRSRPTSAGRRPAVQRHLPLRAGRVRTQDDMGTRAGRRCAARVGDCWPGRCGSLARERAATGLPAASRRWRTLRAIAPARPGARRGSRRWCSGAVAARACGADAGARHGRASTGCCACSRRRGSGAEAVFLALAAARRRGWRAGWRAATAPACSAFLHVVVLGLGRGPRARLLRSTAMHATALRGLASADRVALLAARRCSPSTGCSVPDPAREASALGARARRRRVALAGARASRSSHGADRESRRHGGAAAEAGRPDVFLISLDTTRADRLSLYGYDAADLASTLDGLRRGRADLHAGALDRGVDAAGARVDADRAVSRAGTARTWPAAGSRGESIDGRRNVAYPARGRQDDARRGAARPGLHDRRLRRQLLVPLPRLRPGAGLPASTTTRPGSCCACVRRWCGFAQQTFDPGFCLKPFRTARDINAAGARLARRARRPGGRSFAFLNYMEPHQPWLAPPPHDRWVWELPQARRLATKDLYTHAVKHVLDPRRSRSSAPTTTGRSPRWTQALGELRRGAQGARPLRERAHHRHRRPRRAARRARLRRPHGPHALRAAAPRPDGGEVSRRRPPARARRHARCRSSTSRRRSLREAGVPVPADGAGRAACGRSRVRRIAEEDINPFLVADYGDVYDRAMRVLFDGTWKLISTSKGERMLFDLSQRPAGDERPRRRASRSACRSCAQRLESAMSTKLAARRTATGTGEHVMTADGHNRARRQPRVRGACRRVAALAVDAARAGAGAGARRVGRDAGLQRRGARSRSVSRASVPVDASRTSRSSSSTTARPTGRARSWSAIPVRVVPTTGRVGPAVARNQGAAVATRRVPLLHRLRRDDPAGYPAAPGRRLRARRGRRLLRRAGRGDASPTTREPVQEPVDALDLPAAELGDVPLFYTTAAAIRRDAFVRVGGFDAGYATPNVEDTAFGQKLRRLGRPGAHPPGARGRAREALLPRGLLRTDFMRAVSLTRLKLRHPDDLGDNNTSVPDELHGQRAARGPRRAGARCSGCVARLGAGLTAIGAAGGARRSSGSMPASWTRSARSDGWGRALAAVPLLWLELLVVGVGTAVGCSRSPFGRRY